jgi:hydrogenase maturation protease
VNIAVIGVGSPLRSDQVGWDAVELLQNLINKDPLFCFPRDIAIQFASADRPGVNLLHLISNTDIAIVLDSIKSIKPCGTVICLHGNEVLIYEGGVSTHSFDVGKSLALGKTLMLLPPSLKIYGLSVGDGTWVTSPEDIKRLAIAVRDDLRAQLKAIVQA